MYKFEAICIHFKIYWYFALLVSAYTVNALHVDSNTCIFTRFINKDIQTSESLLLNVYCLIFSSESSNFILPLER